MKNRIIILVILCFGMMLSARAQVSMGKWRTHFAYNSVSQITQSERKIYAVSEGALFSIDKEDGVMEYYSKINGLSDSNISTIEYDSANHALLIIYSNGNIDIMTSAGITNIPDLYTKQMNSSKDINQIQFYQNKAYLACNFGILVLNMQKKEVADTYFIGPNASEVKVLNTTVSNGTIYALTATTIFQASITSPNLVNYELWSTVSNLPGSGSLQKIATFSGQLILMRGNKLYKKRSDNTWNPFLPDLTVNDFVVSGGSLSVFTANTVTLVNNSFASTVVNNAGTVTDAEYDAANSTWYFAGNARGVIIYKPSESTAFSYRKPAGPAFNLPWKMKFSGNKLFVVPGGRWATFYERPGYVMMYDKDNWTNISNSSIEPKTGTACKDLVSIAIDPTDNTHFFAASYSSGLYEFKDSALIKYHNFTNSTIENLFGSYQYQMLDGTEYDKDGNLWFLNSYATKSIKVLLKNGTFTQLDFASFRNKPTIQDILISNQNPNQKWVTSCRAGQGIFVFDDNGTITDQRDDKSVFLSTFNYPETDKNGLTQTVSILPNFVYSIAQDKNGVVWVGTDIGPFLFNNLSKVYDSNYTCSRVKIPRNDSTNQADYLLVNEHIKSIAIDGANRKWIGTESSGVYLMSENGQQTIQHFTATNSPLLSNEILSIAINPNSGEVFFGTSQGIVSYQSDASNAGSTFGNVYAYPNPVRQNYTGMITITGLVANTQVKITDITGHLVCQTVSNGSLATWDGKDAYGKRVSTGVYLAICANADGSQSTITKILVIN